MDGDQLIERRIRWYSKGPRGQGDYRGVNFLELKKQANQLLVDNLTGIYNGEGLKQIFEEYLGFLRRKEINLPLRIFYLDLDGFKEINDRFGHDMGDKLLKEVARLFKKNLRNEDVVARLHGDEFVVLAFTSDEGSIKDQLRGCLDLISSDWVDNIEIGFSIGSAEIGEGFDENGNLIKLNIEDVTPNFFWSLL